MDIFNIIHLVLIFTLTCLFIYWIVNDGEKISVIGQVICGKEIIGFIGYIYNDGRVYVTFSDEGLTVKEHLEAKVKTVQLKQFDIKKELLRIKTENEPLVENYIYSSEIKNGYQVQFCLH